jgi:hypothetical protein
MVVIAKPFPRLSNWAMELDTLGWDNLLEGRIGREILPLQMQYMKQQDSPRHIKSWMVEFIHRLLGITHKQWIYRNTRTHLRLIEGKTASEHRDIMEQVSRLLLTYPNHLLPQHRHLLEFDFEKLGAALVPTASIG